MSLTKAEILTEVNQRLGLSETDIDAELLAIMQDLAALVPGMMQKTDDITILASGHSGTLPTDIIDYLAVVNEDGVPLVKKPFGLVIGKLRADVATSNPEIYAFFNGDIYVHPKVTAETTLTIYYNHDDVTVGSILAPIAAKEALVEGVCFKVELGHGVLGEMPPNTVTHYNFYQEQIKILQARYKIYSE